ncbi:DNA polymerase epsilon subunit 2 [Cichlidogyrus casuarinus]|uniref:DNA polymerase epsilon subunit n=1 Tax=Cichlidogyrus casuarinus TaxID=1844966 RepID=A0ABD2QBK5_9PLAT
MLRQKLCKDFKLHGLTLEPQASKYITSIFERIDQSKHDKVIGRLINTLLGLNLESTKVTKEQCEEAVNSCKAERTDELRVVNLIDSYQTPKFCYDPEIKKFKLLSKDSELNSANLFPNSALPKSFLVHFRYQIIYQRLLRNQIFKSSGSFKLLSVEHLLASGRDVDEVIVLGLLVQSKDYKWTLEDPTGVVPLDLTQSEFHQGLFPEGSIVLIEGSFFDGVLVVTGLGLPPTEASRETLNYFSIPDPLSGKLGQGQLDKFEALMTSSQAGVDSMVVFLGETRLNQPDIVEKLNFLFSGFSSAPPLAFVLFGDFLTSETTYGVNAQNVSILEKLLKQLLQAFVMNYPEKKARPQLVLVPGPNDPIVSPSRILPYASLRSDLISADFQQDIATNCADLQLDSKPDSKYRWLHLMSNPCRMRVFSRSVVLFRSQYNDKLINHCIHLPKMDVNQTELDMSSLLGTSLAQCLASQSHLSPLPIHISPIYWPLDQALHLHPLPDLVVCAEPNPLANLNAASPVEGCVFMNPERFGQLAPRSSNSEEIDSENQFKYEFSFKVWYPSSHTVEDSKLPEY